MGGKVAVFGPQSSHFRRQFHMFSDSSCRTLRLEYHHRLGRYNCNPEGEWKNLHFYNHKGRTNFQYLMDNDVETLIRDQSFVFQADFEYNYSLITSPRKV